MNQTTKRLMEYANAGNFPENVETQQRLIKLTVNEVLGIAYQELHPQAYAQLLAKVQQRFEQ